MTITLGSIAINENMYLDGINNAQVVATNQYRTIDGLSVPLIKETPGGRALTLGSVVDSSTMGIWCQNVVDEIKAIEALGQVLILDYHGDIYNVIITSVEFDQLLKWEEVSPTKKYTGVINMLEV